MHYGNNKAVFFVRRQRSTFQKASRPVHISGTMLMQILGNVGAELKTFAGISHYKLTGRESFMSITRLEPQKNQGRRATHDSTRILRLRNYASVGPLLIYHGCMHFSASPTRSHLPRQIQSTATSGTYVASPISYIRNSIPSVCHCLIRYIYRVMELGSLHFRTA